MESCPVVGCIAERGAGCEGSKTGASLMGVVVSFGGGFGTGAAAAGVTWGLSGVRDGGVGRLVGLVCWIGDLRLCCGGGGGGVTFGISSAKKYFSY